MAAVLATPAAAVSAAARLGAGARPAQRAPPATLTLPPDGVLPGVIAATGLGVGEAVQLRRPEPQVPEAGADPATEGALLHPCARYGACAARAGCTGAGGGGQ